MLDLKIASCNLLGPANAIIFLGIWIISLNVFVTFKLTS
jgi:hypothetical protein